MVVAVNAEITHVQLLFTNKAAHICMYCTSTETHVNNSIHKSVYDINCPITYHPFTYNSLIVPDIPVLYVQYGRELSLGSLKLLKLNGPDRNNQLSSMCVYILVMFGWCLGNLIPVLRMHRTWVKWVCVNLYQTLSASFHKNSKTIEIVLLLYKTSFLSYAFFLSDYSQLFW